VSYVETASQPVLARDESRTLFGQTMGLVAVTAGLFALEAYLGRDLSASIFPSSRSERRSSER
jgi:modulator of FtsH protease